MKRNQANPVSVLLNQKWKSYTAAGAAAAAAGLVGNAGAAISFIDFNDTVIADPVVGDLNWGAFPVDFDNNAQADALIGYRQFNADSGTANLFPAAGATSAFVGFAAQGFNYPSRLQAPASIGPSAAFIALVGNFAASPPTGRADMAWGPGYTESRWVAPAGGPPSTGYLGIRFQIAGADHFGWVRVSVNPNGAPGPRAVTVHDAAYETTPRMGIAAGAVPEPGGLGLLALGGVGLLGMRRRKAGTP